MPTVLGFAPDADLPRQRDRRRGAARRRLAARRTVIADLALRHTLTPRCGDLLCGATSARSAAVAGTSSRPRYAVTAPGLACRPGRMPSLGTIGLSRAKSGAGSGCCTPDSILRCTGTVGCRRRRHLYDKGFLARTGPAPPRRRETFPSAPSPTLSRDHLGLPSAFRSLSRRKLRLFGDLLQPGQPAASSTPTPMSADA